MVASAEMKVDTPPAKAGGFLGATIVMEALLPQGVPEEVKN